MWILITLKIYSVREEAYVLCLIAIVQGGEPGGTNLNLMIEKNK